VVPAQVQVLAHQADLSLLALVIRGLTLAHLLRLLVLVRLLHLAGDEPSASSSIIFRSCSSRSDLAFRFAVAFSLAYVESGIGTSSSCSSSDASFMLSAVVLVAFYMIGIRVPLPSPVGETGPDAVGEAAAEASETE